MLPNVKALYCNVRCLRFSGTAGQIMYFLKPSSLIGLTLLLPLKLSEDPKLGWTLPGSFEFEELKSGKVKEVTGQYIVF